MTWHLTGQGLLQAVVLLDGKQVNDFTFSNGVFKTSPISWPTPTGETVSVLLNLQFSAFSGEGLRNIAGQSLVLEQSIASVGLAFAS